MKSLGESRSQAVWHFIVFESSLHFKGQFPEFKAVIDEYSETLVMLSQYQRLTWRIHLARILLAHARGEKGLHSTTTKIHDVFDASSKTTSSGCGGHSLRLHRVALIANISCMYRAIVLSKTDSDHHHFLWRNSLDKIHKDYRMTCLIFGVSASSFM